MPIYSLNTPYTTFTNSLNRSYNLVSKVNNVPAKYLNKYKKDDILELAFLMVYKSWENFLAESFLRYMAGASSISGKQPERYVNTNTIEKSRYLLMGEKNSNRIIPWAGEFVRQKSIVYFKNGEPFESPLSAITTYLSEIKTIRNTIAHGSKESKAKFQKLVNSKLTNFTGRMKPGTLLSKTKPNENPVITFFEYYCKKLELASYNISFYR